MAVAGSHTGQWLRTVLSPGSVREAPAEAEPRPARPRVRKARA
jgi:hypothetical protein